MPNDATPIDIGYENTGRGALLSRSAALAEINGDAVPSGVYQQHLIPDRFDRRVYTDHIRFAYSNWISGENIYRRRPIGAPTPNAPENIYDTSPYLGAEVTMDTQPNSTPTTHNTLYIDKDLLIFVEKRLHNAIKQNKAKLNQAKGLRKHYFNLLCHNSTGANYVVYKTQASIIVTASSRLKNFNALLTGLNSNDIVCVPKALHPYIKEKLAHKIDLLQKEVEKYNGFPNLLLKQNKKVKLIKKYTSDIQVIKNNIDVFIKKDF
jgi:hypothetical protein